MSCSPSPPSLDELREYASEFELDELLEELDRKVEQDRIRDRETSQKLAFSSVSPGPEKSNATGDDSDEALVQLFGRLPKQKLAIKEEEGGSVP
jgi:hypothetical protein